MKVFVAIPIKGNTDVYFKRKLEVFEWCRRRNNIFANGDLELANPNRGIYPKDENKTLVESDLLVTLTNSERDKYCDRMLRIAKANGKRVIFFGG